MSFQTGLANRLAQGFETRIQDKRSERLQDKQFKRRMEQEKAAFPLRLEQDQATFEQREMQQEQSLPRRLNEQEQQIRLKRKLAEEFEKLPVVNDPQYLQAEQNHDIEAMLQLADTPEKQRRLESWWKMIGNFAKEIQTSKEKEQIRTKGYSARRSIEDSAFDGGIAETISGRPAPRKSSDLTLYRQEQVGDLKAQLKDIAREISNIDKGIRETREKLRNNRQRLAATSDEDAAAELAAAIKAQSATIKDLQAEKEMKEAEIGDIRGRVKAATGGAERKFSLDMAPTARRQTRPTTTEKRADSRVVNPSAEEWKPSPEAEEMLTLLRELRGQISPKGK